MCTRVYSSAALTIDICLGKKKNCKQTNKNTLFVLKHYRYTVYYNTRHTAAALCARPHIIIIMHYMAYTPIIRRTATRVQDIICLS
jgi:hypothetical protein